MTEHYGLLKLIHMGCAWLSISGFMLRGWLRWQRSAWVQRRVIRILPHVIDTLLLATALAMASLSAQWPLSQDWLTAKLFALVLYIALGMIAFRFGRTTAVRGMAFAAAVVIFGYILAVATTRNPLPFAT